MKLEKGIYVRTKGGTIEILGNEITPLRYEIINFNNQLYCEDNVRCDNIKKTSNNIIDLIEVGDVIEINNEKYEVIYDTSYAKLGLLIPNREHLSIRHCSLEYIVSNLGRKEFGNINIVTKEQFLEMEYKI